MFQKFFIGRNGPDHLSFASLMVALAATLITSFIKNPIVYYIGNAIWAIFMAYALFRMLSRNVYKRREENAKFLTWWYKVKNAFKGNKQNKTHKVFKCPNCRQKLRVSERKRKDKYNLFQLQNKIHKEHIIYI